MRTFKLDKLIRDGILKRMEQDGQSVDYHNVQGQELASALTKKLIEEATEFSLAKEHPIEELADLLAVLKSVARVSGYDWQDVIDLEADKELEKGGFLKGIYVDTVTLDENDPFVEYYAKDPSKYPEVQ